MRILETTKVNTNIEMKAETIFNTKEYITDNFRQVTKV